jgi:hypothetical protein
MKIFVRNVACKRKKRRKSKLMETNRDVTCTLTACQGRTRKGHPSRFAKKCLFDRGRSSSHASPIVSTRPTSVEAGQCTEKQLFHCPPRHGFVSGSMCLKINRSARHPSHLFREPSSSAESVCQSERSALTIFNY